MEKITKRAILFTNYTNEDFKYLYGGVEYNFKANTSVMLEDCVAFHFAKHLIDRELNKQGAMTNDQKLREQLAAKILSSTDISGDSSEILGFKIASSKQEVKKVEPVKEVKDQPEIESQKSDALAQKKRGNPNWAKKEVKEDFEGLK
jgi:hypothetical protein